MPGEYLTFTTPKGAVVPALATSWRPNADATVWTFQIRRGVKFHNGKTLTATGRRGEPEAVRRPRRARTPGSRRSSTRPGVSARGQYTVVFRLKSPIGVFPYLLSQTTYQAIIQPAAIAAKPGTWVEERDDRDRAVPAPEVRRQAERRARPQPELLGRPRAARRASGSRSSRAARRWCSRCARGRSTSRCSCPRRKPGPSRTTRGTSTTRNRPRTTGRCRMRTDVEPFRDARVRRAVALVINRPQQIQRVMLGEAQVGNDSPFWRGFASSDRTIQQRTQNLQQARSLLAAAGAGEPEVHLDDVELPRPHRPRRRRSRRMRGRRASRWASRSWTRRSTTTRSRRARTTRRPRPG